MGSDSGDRYEPLAHVVFTTKLAIPASQSRSDVDVTLTTIVVLNGKQCLRRLEPFKEWWPAGHHVQATPRPGLYLPAGHG
jgi:hypothetical protein